MSTGEGTREGWSFRVVVACGCHEGKEEEEESAHAPLFSRKEYLPSNRA